MVGREPSVGKTVTETELRAWLAVYVKGICMGAADMVPGVSGGTIALIVGVYERLVRAIAALDPRVMTDLVGFADQGSRREFVATLREMDITFLFVLGSGIATAVLLMARVMVAAFATYPGHLNAFFFGLIAASAILVGRDLTVTSGPRLLVGGIGFVLAFGVTGTEQLLAGGSLPLVFLAGAIAISAMILPGISGAAFLYILGQYETLLAELSALMRAITGVARGEPTTAVVEPGIVVSTFIAGATVGLLTMARIVAWALAHYRMATLTFLVSLMLGALRLPVIEIRAAMGIPTLGQAITLVLAAAGGLGVILALDWYTETLDYATPIEDRDGPESEPF